MDKRHREKLDCIILVLCLTSGLVVLGQQAPDLNFAAQYHIQTDLGDDRFFRYQTHTGQYRKETLKADGSQEGTYGWVDPNGVLRLFEFIADDLGYRIVKESLYKVGAPNSNSILSTRGGDIQIGFDVYPLDGGASSVGRLGGSSGGLAATRLHLPEGSLSATPGYTVTSLVSTNQELQPNPLTKQEGATYFSGSPLLPSPARIVVGAESPAELPAVPDQKGFIVGHTGGLSARTAPPSQPAAAAGRGFVIGLSHNNGPTASTRLASAPRRSRVAPAPRRSQGIVIGSSRRRRMVPSHT